MTFLNRLIQKLNNLDGINLLVLQKLFAVKHNYLKLNTKLLVAAATCLILTIPQSLMADDGSYSLFESGQVRPLELSPDGKWLFAVNTPASRLEVFEIDSDDGLKLHSSVPVGLDPVAVAARNNKEVWVVNHVSDSVSIVRLNDKKWGVENTLLVGDEPRDIVFAKSKDVSKKAYITTAHRGQNVPYDPQLTTPGVGRADVWVFEAKGARQSKELGGKPLKILNLFTDSPRALAVSNDGTKVYAAGFLTGNKTTVIPEQVVTDSLGLPSPTTNFEGIEQPPTSLIVHHDGKNWVDELDRNWDQSVNFSLPDNDVFIIDASTDDPVIDRYRPAYSGVGTVIFNMAVHPRTGEIFVSNTDSKNKSRFEGPGTFAGHTVRGHIVESRISILKSNGTVLSRHLNKHIDRSKCCESIPNETNSKSLAFPTGMVFSKNGKQLYVAALGSSKIGVFKTNALKKDKFVPNQDDQIVLSGGGPTGLVLDSDNHRLYVLTRFNNSIAIVDTKSNKEISSINLYNPEPEHVVKGRQFLYNASLTSSFGDTACASCHVFGDNDGLAWDLGNPDAMEINNPGPFTLIPQMVGIDASVHFRPMKGPMVTQSLRGMDNHGPMHWRGDRTGGNLEASFQPDSGSFDERAAFEQFNEAFVGLHGRESTLSPHDMELFTEFVLDIVYPPNPIRNLDNSLTQRQQAGHDFYFDRISDQLFTCNGCHLLNPKGNEEFGVKHPGFFGTNGSASFEFEPQTMKIPHFRNLYQKVGMFGMAPIPKLLTDSPDGTNKFMGDQIRGFGYQHDGAVDTIERFISTTLFRFFDPIPPFVPGNPGGFSNDPEIGLNERREVESFLLAYDSNLAPIVGQQTTLTYRNFNNSIHRINLLVSRADAQECDLVANTSSNIGYLYTGSGVFEPEDSEDLKSISTNDLLNSVTKDHMRITFTCAPLGSGNYMAGGISQ